MKEQFGNYKLGSRLKFFIDYWHFLTRDKFVLQLIQGAKLEFENGIPRQLLKPRPIKFSAEETKFLEHKVAKLLDQEIIRDVTHDHENTKWLSNVFLRRKKDNSFRMILDLSFLNKKLKYEKFKMNTIMDVLKMTRRNMYLASIDLREAYFHLFMLPEHAQYLRFEFQGRIMEFSTLPNGLCSGPKWFTRISKIIMNHLRKKLIQILIYLNDTYLCAESEEELKQNIEITLNVLRKCGFTINSDKSCLVPRQEMDFLEFHINTVKYTVSLLAQKCIKIAEHGRKALTSKRV